VAFSHGANDGQKGIGLVMLVLIGVAPAGFVVNMNASGYEITRTRDAVNNVETYFQQHPELLKKATGVDQLIPSPEAGATTRLASSTAIRQTRLTRWNVRKACWAISKAMTN
jgi:low-affinity inorganic phosphate transporter